MDIDHSCIEDQAFAVGESFMAAVYQHRVEQPKTARRVTHSIACMECLLAQFSPICLPEMDHVALLDRTDTKFIMRTSQLAWALQSLADQYRVLEINHTRLNHYQTLYFDTPDFTLYRQHHNGMRTRYKVRVREYLDSHVSYWEVKQKTNCNRTIKARLRAPDSTVDGDDLIDEFLNTHVPFDANELEPKLWNRFLRMTLVSKYRPERLTLDVNLEFRWGDAYVTMPGIAVAEVKQARSSPRSDFLEHMRQLHIRPNAFSKYCAGVYMLYDGVKSNNFKSQMRLVNRLIQEELDHEYAG